MTDQNRTDYAQKAHDALAAVATPDALQKLTHDERTSIIAAAHVYATLAVAEEISRALRRQDNEPVDAPAPAPAPATSWAIQPTGRAAGWYRTRESANWMLYSLDQLGQWHAHALNGDSNPCPWEYIDQAGPIDAVALYPNA